VEPLREQGSLQDIFGSSWKLMEARRRVEGNGYKRRAFPLL